MATQVSESMGWWVPRVTRLMVAGSLALGGLALEGGLPRASAQLSTKAKSGASTKSAGGAAAANTPPKSAGSKPTPTVTAQPGGQLKASSKPAQTDEESLDLLSGEEVGTFLESLGTAVDEGKLADFNRHIDWERISAVASQGFQIPPKSKGKFLAEFRDPQDEETGFSGQVIKSVTTGGSYALVKV